MRLLIQEMILKKENRFVKIKFISNVANSHLYTFELAVTEMTVQVGKPYNTLRNEE